LSSGKEESTGDCAARAQSSVVLLRV